MNENTKISGLIITQNEEKNIKEVLECFDFCDEIILVDSYSTDKTLEIARTFPKVKIFQNKFIDFAKQRNFTIEKACNNWLLFLDADERITPKLRDEILQTVNNPKSSDAYYFPRLFFYERRPIRFSGSQHDKNFRLFKKDKAKYRSDKIVHETLDVNGEIDIMQNKLLHFSYDNYHTYHRKILQYSHLKAKEMKKKNVKYSALIQFLKTLFSFFKSYILKLGLLDGRDGFKLSYLSALSTHYNYHFLKKEYQKVSKK